MGYRAQTELPHSALRGGKPVEFLPPSSTGFFTNQAACEIRYVETTLHHCNLKPLERSSSLQIGKAFLDSYLRLHSGDEIHCLDLYRDNIQRIDIDVLAGWEKMRCGAPFEFLGEDEQRKISRIWRSADQFISADKYLFVPPMFNLGFPAEFKMYIDAICVAGKTYVQTRTVPWGF